MRSALRLTNPARGRPLSNRTVRSAPVETPILAALANNLADSISVIGNDGATRPIIGRSRADQVAALSATITAAAWLDQWPDSCAEALCSALATAQLGQLARCDVRRDNAPGEQRWWEVSCSPLNVDRGHPPLVIASVRDVTDRYIAVESAQLLARELHHRYCNMLTMVQAIIRISAGVDQDPAQFIQAVESRIDALARNHTFLTRNRQSAIDVRVLLEEELAPYTQSGRIAIEGPSLFIGEPTASALSLAFHELTSNAVKYGALSCPGGRLRVSWGSDATEVMTISWSETGARGLLDGAAGFGSMLLDELLIDQLRVDRLWRDDGVLATIALIAL